MRCVSCWIRRHSSRRAVVASSEAARAAGAQDAMAAKVDGSVAWIPTSMELVFAPMPSASELTATKVNAGLAIAVRQL